MTDACCAPSTEGRQSLSTTAQAAVAHTAVPRRPPKDMAYIPGGRFLMGADDPVGFPADGEGPTREIEVSPFYIDETRSHQRPVRQVRQSHQVQDRGGALRLVIRISPLRPS